MQIALQNKIKGLNINNIHFHTNNHHNHHHKNTPQLIADQALVFRNAHKNRESNLTRNSFIPTTLIKSRVEFEKQKKLSLKPLNPAEMSHSSTVIHT